MDSIQRPITMSMSTRSAYDLDLRDVRGQIGARRALEIAAAGGHNVLMIGPPGCGKTMLAVRLPALLPVADGDTECPFRAPHHTSQFLCARLRSRPHEVFACLFLDNRHRVISFEEMFRGTIDGASVHPREVAKRALELNAAALIAAHNHPLG